MWKMAAVEMSFSIIIIIIVLGDHAVPFIKKAELI